MKDEVSIMIKGYKVFNNDWTCRDFQYKVGETYELDGELAICNRGFHFCEKAVDCFNYYSFNPENKVAEVLALGDVVKNDNKSCTNKIQIIREIPWMEVLEIVNTGKDCSGYCNSGNRNSGKRNSGNGNSGNGNSGDWNSGNWNSGYSNSGNRNSGDCNSGDYNSGYYNSGYYNSGNRNSGNYNNGDWNSGCWNKCNFSNGCFNTEEPKIYLFNKLSEWTYRDWLNSMGCKILNRMSKNILKHINWDDMTDEEKEAHPEAKITGGYLKKLDTSKYAITWWRSLSDEDKTVITSLPNFDKDIFKEITGIDIDTN